MYISLKNVWISPKYNRLVLYMTAIALNMTGYDVVNDVGDASNGMAFWQYGLFSFYIILCVSLYVIFFLET